MGDLEKMKGDRSPRDRRRSIQERAGANNRETVLLA
jgi:hypothetical protein